MFGIRDKDIDYTREILSGIVIAIALIPEAIAFSFVLGVSPMVGLYSTVILALITSIFGGRPAMISAATGAVAAVFAPLVKDYGIEYLFIAVILMGIFQIIFGLLNIGRMFRLISKPIMLGFVNGLAIVVLMAQLEQFKLPGTDTWLSGIDMILMLSLTAFTFVMIMVIPKVIKSIPSSLIAIIITTCIALLLENYGVHMYNVYDMAIAGTDSVQSTSVTLSFSTLRIVFIPAISAALVGIVESLLTLNLLDELTDTRGNTKKEVIGQGLANIVCGLAGGMGGCAMVGQSMINHNNGARKYLSTFIAAITLLLFITFGTDIIGLIPLSALVGVMFVVIYKTFAWDSIFLHKKASIYDTFIVAVVAITTVISGNLALGVLCGIILSTIRFVWLKSTKLSFIYLEDKSVIKIEGIIFFGTENILKDYLLAELSKDYLHNKKSLILDCSNVSIVDYSGAQALIDIIDKFKAQKIHLELINLEADSLSHINRITPNLVK